MARSTSSPGIAVSPPESGHSVHVVRRRSVTLNLILSLRPSQWTKNLVVFAGLLFGLQLGDPVAVARAAAAFAIFCALSGVVYLINDVLDRESDRQHPHKASRPIASGAVPVSAAVATAAVPIVTGITASFSLGLQVAVNAVPYGSPLALYSSGLK